jgi:ankyrin repeat protein
MSSLFFLSNLFPKDFEYYSQQLHCFIFFSRPSYVTLLVSLQTYKKRSGTSDRGKDYEWLLCAFYSIKFCTNVQVLDFELFTNNEFFGDFDDVTLRVKYTDGSVKVFLLQLKHSEKAKTLALNSLTAPSGDFTFFKYQKSYDNILSLKNFYFILYTNKTANFKDKTQLTLGDRRIVIRQHSCVGGKLLDTNRGRNCSVFRFESESDQKWDFLSNFYIYVNQQNDTNLKQSISDLLKTRLECDVYTTFVEFMRGWWAGSFKLTKYDVVAKLAELVLSPMVKTVSGEECNEKTRLIEEAILKFDMTIVEPGGGEKITKIWSKTLEPKDMKVVSLTALKFGLVTKGIGKMSDLSMEKQAKVLWFMDQVPLVVQREASRENQLLAVISLLEGCKEKKKIVVIVESWMKKFPNWNVFRNLSDIPVSHSLAKSISKTFSCSLQGKQQITLEQLGVYRSTITSAFGICELLAIATSDNFTIGEPLEALPSIYIPRSFYKVVLNYSVIDGLTNSKILLSCKGQKETVQRKINKRMVTISDHVEFENFHKHTILVSEDEFTQEELDKEFAPISPAHHLRVIDGQNLQWLNSTGSIEELEVHRRVNPGQVLTEDEVDDHFHDRIRILTSHAGNGKKTFLDRLKKQSLLNHLVIRMNLQDHSGFFKYFHSRTDVLQYLEEFKEGGEGYNDFELKFIERFDRERMVLLWDNFEELHPDSRKGFIQSVKDFRSKGVTQWITAQTHCAKLLESEFGVFAMTMLPFSQTDQIFYMQNRCGVADDTTIRDFFRNSRIIDNQEYLGVPLQLDILSDIFCKDPKLLEKIYTLTDMFEAFVDGKYGHYLKRNETSGVFGRLSSIISDAKIYRLEQYKIAALATHLPELCQKLHLQNSAQFLSDVKNGDFLSLIKGVDESGRCIFEPHIIGEYLSAVYLSEHLNIELDQFIFEERHRNVRFMFDLLLAENNPTLVAILYKRFDDIEDCGVKDRAGRTPLHLICSYGERHPVLKVKKQNTIEASLRESVRGDNEAFKRFVQYLCKKLDPLERDELFKWTAFDYADGSCSLGVIEILGGEIASKLPHLRNYSDARTVLYYAVKLNYQKLFNSVESLPYVQDVDGGNLLHLAVEFEREEFLKRLLSNQNHLAWINKSDKDNWTPLHIAAFKGNLTLVKLLLEKGATFPLREPSVMSLATAHGYRNLVEFFLECGCSPNEFYHRNWFTTSLYQAINQRNDTIVELLLKNGAKLYCLRASRTGDLKPNYRGMNLFHLFLENEQFDIVEAILSRGVHIDVVDNDGRTGLHHAALNDQKSAAFFLLAKGANYRILDKDKRSPLHCAAARSLDVAKILVREGAEVDLQDNEGNTPLHLAASNGEVSLVKFLLEAGADPNISDKFKRTPMHTAARYALAKCIELLHHHGGDLEAKDSLYERVPLHLAAWFDNDDCVKILLQKGVQIDIQCRYGYTPLHLAVENCCTGCYQLLLQAGASVDVANCHGLTPFHLIPKGYYVLARTLMQYDPYPLHSAVTRRDVYFIRELLELGHEIDKSDDKGVAPLHRAINCKDPLEIVEMLVQKGADLGKQDREGFTPLHYALQSERPDLAVVQILLDRDKRGETVNIATAKGITPLHIAARDPHLALFGRSQRPNVWISTVELLLDKGARVDAADSEGFTPLHYAACSGSLDTVRFLLERDPFVDRTNKYGRTPLHMAATNGHLSIVKLLLNHQASVLVVDCEGDTPLDDALKGEHVQVFKLLHNINPEFDVATTNHRGRTILHAAAKQGLRNMVKFFQDLVPVDVVDLDDSTAIEDALFNRHFEVFNLLLTKSNLDVNKCSKRHKRYPLHVVACTGTLDLVKSFLHKGAKVDVVDEDGNTPLHSAVNYGHKQVFFAMLESDPGALHIKNNKGQTVLHLAAEKQTKSWIKLLVAKGARIDAVDSCGRTPFQILFHADCVICEELLLFKLDNFDVDGRSPVGNKTLLHVAGKNESMETVKWLVEKGASIEGRDSNGDTPLHCSAQRSTEILCFLLDHYKDSVDLENANNAGETILHLAASYSLDNVKRILEMGASAYATTKLGETPLHYALNIPECFRFLWRQTPEMDISNVVFHATRTILHEAAFQGKLGLARFCLEIGLKINEVDEDGHTPLSDAAEEKHLDILALLLEEDKTAMIVNSGYTEAQTLLHIAAYKGDLELVKLLVRRKARMDLRDENGRTAADLAREEHHQDIYHFLTERV